MENPQLLRDPCTAGQEARTANTGGDAMPDTTGLFRRAHGFLSSANLLARGLLLVALTLALTLPLGLVGGVASDRQSHQQEAVRSVQEAWGGTQVAVGPLLVVPYKTLPGTSRTLTLLPHKLTIEGAVAPQQRKRGLFAVTVYRATLDVVAEFSLGALREAATDARTLEWQAVRLTVGLSEERAIEGATLDVDGTAIEWAAANGPLSSLGAELGALGLNARDSVVVRLRLAFRGSGALSVVPLGRQTETSLVSPWPSPSFMGRSLPEAKTVGPDGFRAHWATSHLGRGYGQLWDSGVNGSEPPAARVLDSAFGVALINPVDAYRETERAVKYGIMIIGLTLASCLLFELATGTRPHAAQYGLIGLALCVFYLLLLSLSEQLSFGPAYLASAAAIVVQAALYNWALQRRRLPAAAFGALLAALYGGLYVLLQLEDESLLFGSLLLFGVLSVAMWLSRNLHRAQPA
jgi:inner membrane protein